MPQRARHLGRYLGAALLTTLVVATRLEASDACVPMPVAQGAAPASGPPPAQDRVAIASLNTAGNPRIADALVVWTRERAFDVLLLQEVGNGSHDGAVFATALSARLGYHFAYAPAQRLGKSETQGLAIVSRYPLDDIRTYPLTHHRLRFRSRCRIGLAATLHTNHGAVRVMKLTEPPMASPSQSGVNALATCTYWIISEGTASRKEERLPNTLELGNRLPLNMVDVQAKGVPRTVAASASP